MTAPFPNITAITSPGLTVTSPSLGADRDPFDTIKIQPTPVPTDLSSDDGSKSDSTSMLSPTSSRSSVDDGSADVVKQSPDNKAAASVITAPSTADPVLDQQKVQDNPQEVIEVAYDGKKPPTPRSVAQICEDIVDVLARYRLVDETIPNKPWGAKAKFLSQVESFVSKEEAIAMSLPAFPFKSPNKVTKVLGTLPDKGEEVALSHLEGLCLAIRDVYEPGANIDVVSDGLMYSDILGVSDLEVWRYGQALRQMAKDCKCEHIKFFRLRNFLGPAESEAPLTEEEYLKDAPLFRNEMLARYLPENFDPATTLAEDADTTCTYRGYIKFLETDLAHRVFEGDVKTKGQFKKDNEEIAKRMIVRGKAFAVAIARNLSRNIRLSIHPSTETTKLSMSLIPQTGRCSTPWHGALVRAIDGSITMSHAAQVPAKTHDLVYDRNGLPSYFRERSPLFHWPGMDVVFDYKYPTGLIITPRDPRDKYSLRNVHMQKVRGLSELCSPVVLRGFTDTMDLHTFESKAWDAGTIAPWTFGNIQTIKEAGASDGKSSVTSSEAMPMHYDGMFFRKKEIDPVDGIEKKVSKVPRFQYFTAVNPSPPGNGMTLFASSQLFFRFAPPELSLAKLQDIIWTCKHSAIPDLMTDLPLVISHPGTNKPCIRWFEPWYKFQTNYSYNEIKITNGEQDLKHAITKMLYDRRVCFYYNFELGDVLLADNFSMMHTRTAFKAGAGRELWRIHLN